MIIEPNRFYYMDEVSSILGVTQKTIWVRIRNGSMRPLQGLGRKKGYLGSALLEMLNNSDQTDAQ